MASFNDKSSQENISQSCLGGCGFYGSAATGGYCSVCSRKLRQTPNLSATESKGSVAPLSIGGGLLSSTSTLSSTESTSTLPSKSGELTSTDGNKPSEAAGANALPNTNVTPSTSSVALSTNSNFNASLGPQTVNANSATVNTPLSVPTLVAGGSGAPVEPEVSGSAAHVNRSRCFSCKKKVGLTGFECKCGSIFCSTHRYADQHSCQFDYQKAHRDNLSKHNLKVTASKLDQL